MEAQDEFEPRPSEPLHPAELRALLVLDDLNRAAAGHFGFEYQLSIAMDGIQNCADRDERVTDPATIVALQRAATGAHAQLRIQYPSWDRLALAEGFLALSCQLTFWSAAESDRARWLRDEFDDMRDTARILRNELHNLCLRASLRGRGFARAPAGADELLRQWAERLVVNDRHNEFLAQQVAERAARQYDRNGSILRPR